MDSIILKDEYLMTSPAIVGYKVMSYMRRKGVSKISIFDVADHFKQETWFSPKSLYFSLLFLFTLDIIDFSNSYVVLK
jgi:hypothetical protein